MNFRTAYHWINRLNWMVKFAIIFTAVLTAKITASEQDVKTDELVENINKVQKLWKAESNEISRKGLSYLKGLTGASIPKQVSYYSGEKSSVNITIPDSFDAREVWPECPSISSIKQQGRCGSCWAVTVASCASDRFCIQSKYRITVNVSAYNLLACCEFCHSPRSHGCVSGDPGQGWNYFKKVGMSSGGDYDSKEGCQPYPIAPVDVPVHYDVFKPKCSFTCSNKRYNRSFMDDIYKGTSAYVVKRNEVSIQKEIMKNGPVVGTMQMFQDFAVYSSGIYKKTSSSHMGGHAVRLIGWGVENGTKYWLAANSWGRNWGEGGFFRILRGTNECEIEGYVTAGSCDPDAPLSLPPNSSNARFRPNSSTLVICNLVLAFLIKDIYYIIF